MKDVSGGFPSPEMPDIPPTRKNKRHFSHSGCREQNTFSGLINSRLILLPHTTTPRANRAGIFQSIRGQYDWTGP